MKKTKNKKRVLLTMMEYEKKYFPKYFERKKNKEPTNARALGISWAKKSLEKVRNQLKK